VKEPFSDAFWEALVRDVVAGKVGTRRRFVECVAPSILRTVRQVLGNTHPDVEDISQEALVSALEALPNFRGDCSVLHFVRRIALLGALSARRKAGQRHHQRTGARPLASDER
jgi:DNA-directed RNA polymerase specialized sigma24 family protein